ncbi:MAG: hypothetical protein A2Y89_07125 [Chloroflexi bacterium RBG_13_51_18]|nr:MAG: hypothetical protein A2Y89_07125 [Chloroflexi bacterium RBG_13_51_18]
MTGDVKALINLKDGTIQLEGPQEFVEKYLDQYKQLIVGLPTAHKTSKTAETIPIESDKTPKRKTRAKSGPTCTQKVQELLDEAYFKQPKTREDVQNELLNRGLRFSSSEVSARLINFFNSGKLKRTGTGKNAQYYSNV